MKSIIVFLLLFPSVVNAQYFEPFSKQDIWLQSIYTGVTVIDWMQTKTFRETGHKEMNPILGSDPDQKTIDSFILAGIISHGLISYALPKKYRSNWQMFFIGVETHAVIYNHKNGIRLSIGYRKDFF